MGASAQAVQVFPAKDPNFRLEGGAQFLFRQLGFANGHEHDAEIGAAPQSIHMVGAQVIDPPSDYGAQFALRIHEFFLPEERKCKMVTN